MHLRLAGLRLFDEAPHAGELSVETDARCFDDNATAHVDGAADHAAVKFDVDGQRLARQQRGVDARGAVDDDTVGRDGLAGAHHEAIVDLKLADGHAHLDAIAQHGGIARCQVEQGVERLTRRALGARLEVAAEQDEDGDGGGDLEVHFVRTSLGPAQQLQGHRHAGHAGLAEEEGVQAP